MNLKWHLLAQAAWLFCLPGALFSQQSREYNPNFQLEYFFGNHPNPRTEALGRADVAVGGAVSSTFYNPAGIGLLAAWEVDLSTSAPFYLERQANFYYAGYAHRFHPKLAAALSVNQVASGPIPGFGVSVAGVQYAVDEPVSTNLGLTLAATPIPNLHLGLNANLYRMKFFDEVNAAWAPHVDVGALYRLPLTDQSHLQFGASLTNVLFSSITFQSPIGTESSSHFPVTGRLGLTYQGEGTMNLPGAQPQPIQLLVTLQGQELLNAAERRGIYAGTEVLLARVVALRLGAYSEKWVGEPGGMGRDPRPRIADITYGFGIIVPLSQLSKGKLPFSLRLDYCSLEQAPFAFSTERFPNRRSLGLRLVADLPSNQ
jgi:hypothetical protein